MSEYTEDKPTKADCGHYVSDHNELVEIGGKRFCPDCAAAIYDGVPHDPL